MTPLGWNVVGLDSNDVTAGPNQFPIGVRVCNASGGSQTLKTKWEWLSSNANVNLASGTSDAIGPFALAASTCRDVYYTVEVTRTNAAYLTSRNYRIGVTDNSTTLYTPTNRQIYVEKLVSQNRNSVQSLEGPGIGSDTTPVLVGNEYTYTLKGSTATQGYEQLVFATIFDPRYFEVLSISTAYSADTSTIVPNPNDQVYADACGWNNDYTSASYRSCVGTGKAGGTMTSTINVRVIGAGSTKLNSIIYDFSGSSYHYNSDYGAAALSPSLTPKQPNPKLSIVKTSNPATFNRAGQTVNYSMTVTNTGDVPIGSVIVSDPMFKTLTCTPKTPVASLAVGSSITCAGSYTTVQADVERGYIDNTASTSGTAPDGSPVVKDTTLRVPGPAPAPELSVVKTSDPTTFSGAKQALKFTAVATNTGNITLTNVIVTDNNADVKNWSCNPTTPVATLAPGAKITCTGDYATTQADVDSGKVFNSVTASGKDGQNNAVTGTANIQVPGPVPNPKFAVVKRSEPATFSAVGQLLNYTVTVTNIGNVRLSSVQVTDKNVSVTNWGCTPETIGTLAPGESATCTGKYLTTQDDVELGKTTNSAEATGRDPQNNVVTGTGNIEVPGPAPAPSLVLSKAATPTFFNAVGQSIQYTVVATNTGNVTLKNVSVTDGNADVKNFTCSPTVPAATLAPGAKITCTGGYTTTQADVDAGKATNAASTSGTAPDNSAVTANTSINVPGPPPNPKLAVVKTASPATFSGPGQKLDYTITVTNTGNVGLTGVSVSDPKLGTLSCSPNTPTALAVGGKITCTGGYTTTQADVEAGGVTNTATATGKDPQNQTVTGTGSVEAPGPSPAPNLVLSKTSDPDFFSAKGQSLQYKVVATNTGNVTLTNVTVSDNNAAITNWSCPATSPVATLAPGAKVTCTGDYKTTQSDVDAGKTINAASATGKAPDNSTVNASTSIDVPGPRAAPQLSVAKSVNPQTFSAAGQKLTYAIMVTNTGNVTLTNVTVSDPVVTVSCPPPFPAPSTLAPGGSLPCLATYTTTQADVEAGKISNTATATGKGPQNQDVTGTGSVDVPGPAPAPALALTKSSTPTFFSAKNQTLQYTVVATNTGNVTLKNVSVTDNNAGVTNWSCPATSPVATLAPGATVTCTGDYKTTQADVDAGKTINAASATSKAPDNSDVNANTSIDVPGPPPAGQLSVVKSSSPAAFSAAGQTLNYTITVSNAGNVTLTNVSVSDPMFAALNCTPNSPVSTLAPAASITCTGSYQTTQMDVNAGKVTNTATATGKDPKNQTVTGTGSVDTPGPAPAPQLVLTKSASPTYFDSAGTPILYTVVATNTGNVTLTNVSVTDNNAAVTNWTCKPTTPVATLAPGAKVTCIGNYTTTQADLDAGKTVNTASATSKAPDNSSVTANTSIDVPGPAPAPAVAIVKTATQTMFTDIDEPIDFSVTATNIGNVTLKNVSITDGNPAFIANGCTPESPVSTLAPGASITCTGTVFTTEGDEAFGMVSNTATVQATTPGGQTLTKTSSVDVPFVKQEPAIDIKKTANRATFSKSGDKISYTITATNVGNTYLDSVSVYDPVLWPDVNFDCTWAGEYGHLEAGESVVCFGDYFTSQSDVNAGQAVNIASVIAEFDGIQASDTTKIIVPGPPPNPGVALTKTANPTTFSKKGQTISYTITATNTGNVSLDPVTVTDPSLAGLYTCTYPDAETSRLMPGESLTCTGDYLTTSADVQAGATSNAASVAGFFGTTKVTDSADITVPGPAASSALAIVKSSTPATFSKADETLTFSVTATNVGNQPLTAVSVVDAMTLENWTCAPATPVATLAPDASITCTGEYLTTQADVDTGSLVNSVAVTGKDPGNKDVTKSTQITVDGPPASPAISLAKTANPTTFSKVGDKITYTVTATNTGNVTLTNVVVTDPPFDNLVTWKCVWPEGTPPGSLAPQAQVTCTAPYATVQADVEAGRATNAASVEGFFGTTQVTGDADVTVPGPPLNPAIAITKSSNPAAFSGPNQTISYVVEATNTGNVMLSGVNVTDTMTLTGWQCNPSTPVATLAPGAKVTCSGSYTTTQDDVQAGKVNNSATATATGPGSTPVSATAALEVQGPDPDPAISLVKSADPIVFSKVGDVITYTVTAKNTGNLRLTGVTVTDNNAGVKNWTCTLQAPAALAPGSKITCMGDYTTTQADVEAGKTSNSASVEGYNGETKVTANAAVEVPGPAPKAALSIVKSATPTSFSGPGQKVTFAVIATNAGNLTLTNVNITESMQLANWSCSPAVSGVTLLPGQQVTCGGGYITTQDDVEAGNVTNAVEVSGTPPGTQTPISKTTDVVVSGPDPNPAISIIKKALPVTFDRTGQTIHYTVEAQNKGNVTLSNVNVTDQNPGVKNWSCTPSATMSTLAPGATISCTGEYSTTQADVEAGQTVNSAKVISAYGENSVEDTDVVTVPGPKPNPALTIVKSSTPATFPGPGQKISFSITATNAGNLTLSNVSVNDPLLQGDGSWQCTPAAPATLTPGQAMSCSGDYITSQNDVELGKVANVAEVKGTPPVGSEISKTTTINVPGPDPNPTLAVVKTSNPTAFEKASDPLVYTVVVTNTGNVTIQGVTVEDVGVSLTCDVQTPKNMAPRDKIECTGSYTTTQDDVDTGQAENTATAKGTAPNGDRVEESGTVVVPGPKQNPFLSVVKTSVPTTFSAPEETLNYSVVVTNTGNVKLTNVTPADVGVADFSCTPNGPRTLLPGESINCTGSHETTQADVNAGHVDNIATASGKDPVNKTVTGSGEIRVPGPASSPQLQVVKTASPDSFDDTGVDIDYSVTATNIGNVTLHDVGVTDNNPNVTGWSCGNNPPTTLQPEDSITCTGKYTTTQADVNAGQASNSATASGKDPNGRSVDTTAFVYPLGPERDPLLTLTKTAEPETFSSAGQDLTFKVTAKNDGNVTLYAVAPVDNNPDVTNWTCSPATPVTLQPDDSVTCTGGYVTTDADVDAGKLFNSASASAEAPNGSAPEKSVEKEVDGPSAQPALTLTKSAKPDTFAAVGQIIDYSFLVKNTGNVSITNLAIDDPRLSSPAVCPVVTLAAGAQTTCSGTYAVTQADVDAGTLINTATATGTPARGQLTAPTSSVTITKNETNVADLSISQTNSGPIIVDNKARFTLTIANEGPASASGVKVSDSLPKGLEYVSASGSDWNCSADGRDVTCTLAAELTAGTGSRSKLKDFPVGAKSSFDLFVRATEAARPSVVNVATVSSTTTDPNLSNNTSSSRLIVERKQQVAKKANKVEVKPGALIVKPGESVANRRIRAKVSCKRGVTNAAGEVSFCRVHRGKNGRVIVKAVGAKPVKVRVLFWAPGTKKYKPYRKVQTFVLKPKR